MWGVEMDNKLTACNLTYELLQCLNMIDDEDFIDKIVDAVRYNDSYCLAELSDNVRDGNI